MKEIVIMSGKGGTGKTTITAALGALAGKEAVIADCDVDAANLHLLYQPKTEQTQPFNSGKTAVIDNDVCSLCGICQEKCRFDAIRMVNGSFYVDEVECEGCSLCHHVCPESAIKMRLNHAGNWFLSKSRFDTWFVHAALGIGQENSGKLVTRVKEAARELARVKNLDYILVDGPPGIGCPVISAFSGINHVLIVTEATNSGLHDLKRLTELIQFFKADASCLINKADLNREAARKIRAFCKHHRIAVIAEIPYDQVFIDTLNEGKILLEGNNELINQTLGQVWHYIKNMEN